MNYNENGFDFSPYRANETEPIKVETVDDEPAAGFSGMNVSTDYVRPAEEKKKRGLGVRGGAGVIAVCVIISLLVGIGGGYLGYRLAIADPTGKPEIVINSDVQPLTGESLALTEVVKKTQDSVVEIRTETVVNSFFLRQYVTEGAGSGVILSADGYIVTNHHVIENAEDITVTLHNGETAEATLVATDAKTDLAVIKIDASGLTAATIGDSSQLVVGQAVLAIGNPLGSLGGTVTDGIISALDREITIGDNTYTLLQTSAAVNPGNSGGGLFDEHGYLIGIVNSKVNSSSDGSAAEALGFAIPSNTVAKVTGELIDHGYVSGRTSLGVTLINIADERTAMMYRVEKPGIYIGNVEKGSNADTAGLMPGDMLVSINNIPIKSIADAESVVKHFSAGDIISFTVYRNGMNKTVSVILAEDSPN